MKRLINYIIVKINKMKLDKVISRRKERLVTPKFDCDYSKDAMHEKNIEYLGKELNRLKAEVLNKTSTK